MTQTIATFHVADTEVMVRIAGHHLTGDQFQVDTRPAFTDARWRPCRPLAVRHDDATTEAANITDWLASFAQHMPGCRSADGQRCTCGRDAALLAYHRASGRHHA